MIRLPELMMCLPELIKNHSINGLNGHRRYDSYLVLGRSLSGANCRDQALRNRAHFEHKDATKDETS